MNENNIENTVDLNEIINKYKIFIDLSSLIHKSSAGFFLEYFYLFLERSKNQLIVPIKVVEELKKLEINPDKSIHHKGKKALNIIKKYQNMNLIKLAGENNDPEGNELFKKVFKELSTKYDMCLITQNKKLAKDIQQIRILQQNNFEIKNFKPLRIINKTSVEEINLLSKSKINKNPSSSPATNKNIKKFKLKTEAINQKNIHNLKVTNIPKEKDYVLNNNKEKILLTKEIGRGGEGCVYLTNNGLVCKVYKKEKITTLKKEKIELMLSNKIECDGICWPLSIAYNLKGEFVGYFMKPAKGREIQKSLFVKPLLMKYFPNWTKQHILNLCICILEKIKYLHKRNVIIGDLNPLNIIIESDTEVYFVDTDSYQIEEYPCPVGTVNFTPPELQGKDYKSFLRTFENEYFAIATLIFMILMPGKPPYSRRGGSDPASNIKETDFAYPYGKERKKKLQTEHGDLFGAISQDI